AFLGEACSSQQRLIIVDVLLERLRYRREAIGRPRILWKNLNGEAVETFRVIVSERLAVEDMSASNADQMWNTLARVMKDAAKDSLGVANESARTHSTHRESWRFCEEVQTKVATKQSMFKDLLSCNEGNQEDIDRAKERYKAAKREAKIAVAKAKDKAYEDLYKKLDSKEGVNDIYKIAKARERKRDIGNVKYIKNEGDKKRLWDALDEMVRECPTNQCLIIGGDLNGHIGAAADGYVEVHGGFGFGDRNEEGAFLGEACSSQQRLIIVDVLLERLRYRREAIGRPRILWKNLNGEAVETFRVIVSERLAVEDMSASNADQMWNTLARVMKDAAKDSLGVANESARTHSTHRESWRFCEEVQTKVATKQSMFKDLLSCNEGNQEDIDRAKERYKAAKREAKIAVAKAKDKAYEDLYKKLDSKEGVNDIYKIAKARERKRDIGNVKYIKNEGGRTIVREKDIRTR
nr:cleavage/polyadenylation specificity factor, 25kDa subunit [Tanacetum cinerariifolium]